jgi:hypothetical protein
VDKDGTIDEQQNKTVVVMEQYRNSNGVMENGNHFKNGADSKSLISRRHSLKNVLKLKMIPLVGMFLAFAANLNAQGTNNNFEYDNTDMNVIFKELGITTFKFPIKQTTDQMLNIVIEEYEDKKILNSISIIDDAKNIFGSIGIDADTYFRPKKDSVYFHRFYFIEKDSIIKIRTKTHGFENSKSFSLIGKSTFSFNAFSNFKSENDKNYLEIDEPEILVYMYANSSNDKDKPLWCPSGLSKEQLLDRFYYFIFISVEPYKDK